MKYLGLLLICLFVAAHVAAAEPNHKAPKPNFVYVLVDDLGWGDLSCFGQTHWETPRLDQMARDGMVFQNAYAGNTVCAPSRAALLTGNHSGRLFQRGNGRVQFRRDPMDITIASRLKALGYATAMIGKSGVACNSDDASLPNDKGFDYFYGLLSHVAAHRNYPEQAVKNGERVKFPGNNGTTGSTYANGVWVEDALKWLEDNHDAPFFLHLSITAPHADLTVPDRYMEPFRHRWPEKKSSGYYFHQPEPRAAYAGMVAFIDESVGRVLDTLRRLEIDENTVVFFASDNGPHFEGGANPEFFDSNGPYRGGKRNMTDGGLKTPQIVWWPGTIEASSATELVTAFWDFPPTALDLAGEQIPASMDGISIAPTLLGKQEQQQEHAYLYWEFHEQGGKQAVRMGHWKGIRLNVGKDREAPIALFDLRTDLAEEHDVAKLHPDVVERIERAMAEAHVPSNEFRFGNSSAKKTKAVEQRLPRGKRLTGAHDMWMMDRSNFSVVSTSSESSFNGMTGAMAIDHDLDTWWHSAWKHDRPTHPHSITIDLRKLTTVFGIRVMSRQDNSYNGAVRDLSVFVTEHPDFGSATAACTTRLALTRDEQEVIFDRPMPGRYVTLISKSGHADTPFASFANIEVLGVEH